MPFRLDHRWASLVRRIFHLDTASAGASPFVNLSDVVVPTFDLANDCPEWRIARAERLLAFTFTTIAAGGPGNYEWGRIVNPAGSGRILVVKRMSLRKGSTGAMLVLPGLATAGAGCIVHGRDGRITTSAGMVVQTPYLWATGAGAALPVAYADQVALGVNVWQDRDTEWVVAPGYGLTVWSSTLNETFDFGVPVAYDVEVHGAEES